MVSARVLTLELPKLLRVEDAAARLSLSVRSVRALCRLGDLTIEEHPAHLRLWAQPAGRMEPRPVWELIVPRESTTEDLRDLEVRIAWEMRVPVDEAVTLAREVRKRLSR